MPEFRMNTTLAIDVEIYFEAADELAADDIAQAVADAACLAVGSPSVQDVIGVDSDMKGVVLDVSWDGPNGAEVNDGPYEDEY
jgi:hypothetical protein